MFLALKVVWLWAVWCFFTRTFVFLTLHSWSQGWRESQGKGIGGARREVEKGMGDEWQSGGKTRHIVTWKKKRKEKNTSTPSSAPRALHPNRLIFPSAPLGRVKPPPTGSGSSVPASSGHYSRSSFDGLLTSHQPSRCHWKYRQKQMLGWCYHRL